MDRERIDAFFNRHGGEMVRDICRLIAVPSMRSEAKDGQPFGEGPARALAEALKIASELGFNPVNHENYVGTVDFGASEPVLTILAHLDVVPEGSGWTKRAFEAALEDGRIYGRGAIDDKGPAVAALYALAAVREIAPQLKSGVRLILGTAEETGSADIAHYFQSHAHTPMTFTPDGSYPVINIEKGRFAPSFGVAWAKETALPRVVRVIGGDTPNVVPQEAYALIEGFEADIAETYCDLIGSYAEGIRFSVTEEPTGLVKIMAQGKSAHASTPGHGNNAQAALLFLLAHMPMAPSKSFGVLSALNRLFPYGDNAGEALGIAMEDTVSGALTLNFGVLNFSETGFTGCFDCRYPVCGTKESVADAAVAALNASGIEITGNAHIHEPHCTPSDSPFVQTLLKVFEAYTGQKGECLAIGGGTYVHDIEGGVAFGCEMPGTDYHMHGPDEFAVIDELIASAKMFTQIILEVCS